MCTFGEIVEPTSRNSWEDWDDYDSTEITEHKTLAWNKDTDNTEEVDNFYIFEGKYLSDCARTQSNFDLVRINTVASVNLELFRLKNSNNFLCGIRNKNEVLSGEVVELLRHYINTCKNLITIQSLPLAEYKSTNMSESFVVRSVKTSTPVPVNPKLEFLKLEQPNILSGVAAGAICLREHLGLCGMALVAYLEYPEEDGSELQTLLKKLNIFHNMKNTPINTLQSNLYI